jgi:hypothetical protein
VGTIALLLPELITILSEAPSVITNVQKIWDLATATTAPTADEQVAYDAALDAAHTALQAS